MPAEREIGELSQAWVHLHDFAKCNNRCFFYTSIIRAKKLPRAIAGIVTHMKNRLPIKDNLTDADHRNIHWIIEWPVGHTTHLIRI